MTAVDARPSFQEALRREIDRRGADGAVPLSAEQRRIWLLSTLSDDFSPFVAGRYRVTGEINPVEVQLRLGQQVAKHEALRSVLVGIGDRPARLVLPLADAEMRVLDLSTGADPATVDDQIRSFAAEPFEISRGPLLRALLVLLPDGRGELVLAGHAAVVDKSSLDTIACAVLTGPQMFGVAQDKPEAELTAAVLTERERSRNPKLIEAAEAWGRRLLAPAATEITGFRARPAVKGHRRDIRTYPVAAGAQVTEERLVAAWLALLLRWQGSDSAVCGVRAGREKSLRGVVGPLDQLRPVRCDVTQSTTLGELTTQVSRQLTTPDAQVSFAQLLEICPPRRDLSRPPYFQTTVGVEDSRRPMCRASLHSIHRVPSTVTSTEHDIAVTLWLQPSGASVHIEYDTDVIETSLADDLAQALATVLAQPDDAALATLPLLAGSERAIAAGRGQETAGPDLSLVDQVQAAVRAHADRIAVQHGETRLTYSDLWEHSGRVAAALHSRGVGKGDRVAVWLHRSAETISALLGVLRAGAAYVPIDPSHPADRREFLLRDSGAAVVVSGARHDPPADVPVLLLEDLTGEGTVPEPPGADDIAYLIYTSGSTGRPKGVAVRHGGVVNNLRWRQRLWTLTPDDKVLHNHAFTFDPSVWATFWPLTVGAGVVVADKNELDDTGALLHLMRSTEVTVLGGVPSLLSSLVDHPAAGECTKVRLVLSGGEPLTPALVEAIRERWAAAVANLYGPTETSIDATAYLVGADVPAIVPIGHAVDNTEVHIVDADLRPLPDGARGEIVVSGAGLAVGYHQRPGLTAARFLPDPFGSGRLYRTGDLGRRRPDGSIEFLGRVDHQVKIRGHRIELHEIQTVLAGLAGVREATVFAVDAGTERARLAAAVVVEDVTADDLRAQLSDLLPAYLVPDHLLAVGEIPLTPNGKIDHKALTGLVAAPAAQSAGREPATELEKSVAQAFAEVLRVDKVAIDADFFEIGGTSIMLSRLAALLSSRHDVEIPLHEFFQVPTIAAVAATIELYRAEGLSAVLGRQHAATLEADGSLPDWIRPDGLPKANWANPSQVLLTGATGYLGLHLVEQLLRRTRAEVVCLCRADDERHALQRLREGFELYEIDVADQLHRVRCVVGDLGKPRLGLSEETWAALAESVDVIYHNGAMVNFVYPYNTLKEPNVRGTQRVLELACTTRLKAVHHVSTIDTLLATHTPRPFLENDAPLHSAVGVPAGYTGSKWVAEKVVNVARQREIPVTVFRPGLILGHTGTGATQTIDYLLVALRGFLPMGILPDYPRIFDIVPVDYVASAIVHVSLNPEALGGFFHLFNPAPVALSTFCDWIKDYGYKFDVVPFEEGRRRALRVPPGHPLYSLVPLIRDAEAEPHRALDPRHIDEVQPSLECAEVLKFLQGSDVACPPTTREQAHAVLAYLIRVGFMPAPDEVEIEAAS